MPDWTRISGGAAAVTFSRVAMASFGGTLPSGEKLEALFPHTADFVDAHCGSRLGFLKASSSGLCTMMDGGSEDSAVGCSRAPTGAGAGSDAGPDACPDAAAEDDGAGPRAVDAAGAATGSEHPTSPSAIAIASAAMNFFMVPPRSECHHAMRARRQAERRPGAMWITGPRNPRLVL